MKRILIILLMIAFAGMCIAEPKGWVPDQMNTYIVTCASHTGTSIVSADSDTREVRVVNESNYTIFVGSASTVATSGSSIGYKILTSVEKIFYTQSEIYAITIATCPATSISILRFE